MPSDDTCRKYESIAYWFDQQRSRNHYLMEKEYLDAVLTELPPNAHILDLGCGTGEPIAGYFIRAGHRVTGIDGSPRMIEKCRERFPEMDWVVDTIQEFQIAEQFDAVIAWDSTFHLPADEQRTMFKSFEEHTKPGGMLLFTSGPDAGEVSGEMKGLTFSYASLSGNEYRSCLKDHGFEVIMHNLEDPNCGNHTVWLARKRYASGFQPLK